MKRDQFLIGDTDISRTVKHKTISVNLSCQVQDAALRIGVAKDCFISLASDFIDVYLRQSKKSNRPITLAPSKSASASLGLWKRVMIYVAHDGWILRRGISRTYIQAGEERLITVNFQVRLPRVEGGPHRRGLQLPGLGHQKVVYLPLPCHFFFPAFQILFCQSRAFHASNELVGTRTTSINPLSRS